VLRKVFGTESEEFTGELRKFRCEELRVLDCLPNLNLYGCITECYDIYKK